MFGFKKKINLPAPKRPEAAVNDVAKVKVGRVTRTPEIAATFRGCTAGHQKKGFPVIGFMAERDGNDSSPTG